MTPEQEQFKRHVAYKLRIGEIMAGKPILEGDRFKFLDLTEQNAGNDKHVSRVNVIANITDKYIQDGEKKFASLTLDDASGQIKVKTFGEDISKFENFSQGDTIMLIGLLREWNNEIYIIPEIIKKRSPQYLMIRKLECDLKKPKSVPKEELTELKDKILTIIKEQEANGGADIDKLILDLKSSPDTINSEIKKLLEEGIIYEPRPGKVRYLG